MVRFLHTADWQIGKPFAWVSDPANRFLLQQERLDVIKRIASVAAEQHASFVLVAGDLFDSPTVPTPIVLEALEAIGSINLPVLVIPGNHDHGGPGSLWHGEDFKRHAASRAPNLSLLLRREPVLLDGAILLPCPLLRRHESRDPAAWISNCELNSLPAEWPRILLAHGTVQGFSARDHDGEEGVSDGTWNRLDLAGLGDAAIDYIALGDWHSLKQISELAWYPGTPEPDRFDQGEQEHRAQVLVVEAHRHQPPRVEVLPTGRINWHKLRFHLEGDGDLPGLERLLQNTLRGRVRRDLIRLEPSGSLSLKGHERFEGLIAELGDQVLHLRLRGGCDPLPRDEELAALTERPGDPLIARVALTLQQRLERQANADDEATVINRAALCELFRLAQG